MRPYDLCREEGHGKLLSIDLHGIAEPWEIEEFMAELSCHPDEYGLDYDEDAGDWISPYRGWNVTHHLRRSVHPSDCDDPDNCWCDWSEWAYEPIPDDVTPDDMIVTRLEIDTTWKYRCYRHRDRVAMYGMHEPNFLAEEKDREPLPIHNGNLYVCRECYDRLTDALRVQSVLLWEQEKRLSAAGTADILARMGGTR